MPDVPEPRIEPVTHEGFLEALYLGLYSLDRFKKQTELSTRACQEAKRTLLLVHLPQLEGYAPTTIERHPIGIHGAATSRTLGKVAVLGTVGQVGRDQYAGVVARNRGVKVRVFLLREEALGWLLTSPRVRAADGPARRGDGSPPTAPA
jgi:hypothetical protein